MYMGFGRVYLRDIMHEGEKAWIKQVQEITVQIMPIRIKQAAGRRCGNFWKMQRYILCSLG